MNLLKELLAEIKNASPANKMYFTIVTVLLLVLLLIVILT